MDFYKKIPSVRNTIAGARYIACQGARHADDTSV